MHLSTQYQRWKKKYQQKFECKNKDSSVYRDGVMRNKNKTDFESERLVIKKKCPYVEQQWLSCLSACSFKNKTRQAVNLRGLFELRGKNTVILETEI